MTSYESKLNAILEDTKKAIKKLEKTQKKKEEKKQAAEAAAQQAAAPPTASKAEEWSPNKFMKKLIKAKDKEMKQFNYKGSTYQRKTKGHLVYYKKKE